MWLTVVALSQLGILLLFATLWKSRDVHAASPASLEAPHDVFCSLSEVENLPRSQLLPIVFQSLDARFPHLSFFQEGKTEYLAGAGILLIPAATFQSFENQDAVSDYLNSEFATRIHCSADSRSKPDGFFTDGEILGAKKKGESPPITPALDTSSFPSSGMARQLLLREMGSVLSAHAGGNGGVAADTLGGILPSPPAAGAVAGAAAAAATALPGSILSMGSQLGKKASTLNKLVYGGAIKTQEAMSRLNTAKVTNPDSPLIVAVNEVDRLFRSGPAPSASESSLKAKSAEATETIAGGALDMLNRLTSSHTSAAHSPGAEQSARSPLSAGSTSLRSSAASESVESTSPLTSMFGGLGGQLMSFLGGAAGAGGGISQGEQHHQASALIKSPESSVATREGGHGVSSSDKLFGHNYNPWGEPVTDQDAARQQLSHLVGSSAAMLRQTGTNEGGHGQSVHTVLSDGVTEAFRDTGLNGRPSMASLFNLESMIPADIVKKIESEVDAPTLAQLGTINNLVGAGFDSFLRLIGVGGRKGSESGGGGGILKLKEVGLASDLPAASDTAARTNALFSRVQNGFSALEGLAAGSSPTTFSPSPSVAPEGQGSHPSRTLDDKGGIVSPSSIKNSHYEVSPMLASGGGGGGSLPSVSDESRLRSPIELKGGMPNPHSASAGSKKRRPNEVNMSKVDDDKSDARRRYLQQNDNVTASKEGGERSESALRISASDLSSNRGGQSTSVMAASELAQLGYNEASSASNNGGGGGGSRQSADPELDTASLAHSIAVAAAAKMRAAYVAETQRLELQNGKSTTTMPPTSSTTTTTAARILDAPQPTTKGHRADGGDPWLSCFVEDVAISGKDFFLSVDLTSPYQCYNLCLTKAECVFFTYAETLDSGNTYIEGGAQRGVKKGLCYLFDVALGLDDLEGAVSGPKDCVLPQNVNHRKGPPTDVITGQQQQLGHYPSGGGVGEDGLVYSYKPSLDYSSNDRRGAGGPSSVMTGDSALVASQLPTEEQLSGLGAAGGGSGGLAGGLLGRQGGLGGISSILSRLGGGGRGQQGVAGQTADPQDQVLEGMGGLGGLAQGAGGFFTTAQALMQAGNQLLQTFPIADIAKAGYQLYNSGAFRNSAGGRAAATGRRKGLQGGALAGAKIGGGVGAKAGAQQDAAKTSMLPPTGVGRPDVTCLSEGMRCCVPRKAAEGWKDNPPTLNDETGPRCTATYVSQTDSLCVTTRYGEHDCGMSVRETEARIVYRNAMKMPGKWMNNAICECSMQKSPGGGDQNGSGGDKVSGIVGSATWEYSLTAVHETEAKKEKAAQTAGKFVGAARQALNWGQTIGDNTQNGVPLVHSLLGLADQVRGSSAVQNAGVRPGGIMQVENDMSDGGMGYGQSVMTEDTSGLPGYGTTTGGIGGNTNTRINGADYNQYGAGGGEGLDSGGYSGGHGGSGEGTSDSGNMVSWTEGDEEPDADSYFGDLYGSMETQRLLSYPTSMPLPELVTPMRRAVASTGRVQQAMDAFATVAKKAGAGASAAYALEGSESDANSLESPSSNASVRKLRSEVATHIIEGLSGDGQEDSLAVQCTGWRKHCEKSLEQFLFDPDCEPVDMTVTAASIVSAPETQSQLRSTRRQSLDTVSVELEVPATVVVGTPFSFVCDFALSDSFIARDTESHIAKGLSVDPPLSAAILTTSAGHVVASLEPTPQDGVKEEESDAAVAAQAQFEFWNPLRSALDLLREEGFNPVVMEGLPTAGGKPAIQLAPELSKPIGQCSAEGLNEADKAACSEPARSDGRDSVNERLGENVRRGEVVTAHLPAAEAISHTVVVREPIYLPADMVGDRSLLTSSGEPGFSAVFDVDWHRQLGGLSFAAGLTSRSDSEIA